MEDSIRRYSYNERKQSIIVNLSNTPSKHQPLQKRRFTTASGIDIGISSSTVNDLKKIFDKNKVTQNNEIKSR
jgi:hypothetical protein